MIPWHASLHHRGEIHSKSLVSKELACGRGVEDMVDLHKESQVYAPSAMNPFQALMIVIRLVYHPRDPRLSLPESWSLLEKSKSQGVYTQFSLADELDWVR